MNGPILRALAADAWQQVLDNRVFRVVALLVLLPTAATFVVGFREEEVVLLFGWKSYSYTTLFQSLNIAAGSLQEMRALLIETVADQVVGFLTGTLGMVVALAATAFFVPRMLERGAADVLFHKPVPRSLFFLSRYVAGLAFVGALATALAVGMFAGLRISSGYTYLGLFWAIPTVLYVFAVFHAISMLVGVWSRSTSASILLTLGFVVFNGCVHTGWAVVDRMPEQERTEQPWSTISQAVTAAHWVLPKTADAEPIVGDLRGRLSPEPERANIIVDGQKLSLARELTWDGDLSRNIPFSIASTLAFTLGVLFIGWRRLERVDF